MTERAARLVLGALVAGLAAAALATDLPKLSGGRFWGDGATYYAMAASLAEDGDIRYEARDVLRIRREYSFGPQGVFLKRASGGFTLDRGAGFPWVRRVGPAEPRLYYAKALVYPALAAPFVALLKTRGLLLVNALFLGLTLVLGYSELRRGASPASALALTVVLFLGTVTPLYVLWLTPEIFTLALVTAGLVAGRRGRPALAAVLLGIAVYSKPSNLFLALPLGVEPVLRGWTGEAGERTWLRGLLESARRGAILGAVVLALFGINAAVTGEANYQGGERKTFDGRYPLESHGVTFDSSGFWMTTEHVGPLVQGEDEGQQSERTDPVRSGTELRASLLWNLGYFWVGRFGGAVPYFFPAVLAVALFLLAGPREGTGGPYLAALLVSYLFYIWLIPANWYGGGGAVGNRYFLNLLPLVLFLVPRGREWVVVTGGAMAGVVFLAPILGAPVEHSLNPGRHATYETFRIFPIELTELNDLAIFTETWRKKLRFGDTEGSRVEHRASDPNAYYLYLPDNGTWGKETAFEGEGVWLRGGASAEVILRALEPVRRMMVRIKGGPGGDEVSLKVEGAALTTRVGPGENHELELAPARGFPYYGTVLYDLHFRSRASGPPDADGRIRGAFVQIKLEAEQP
ncbi:MAG TPA: hypothetical protein VN461_15060 [Vicinamibacteria bacterium]|nr:hypothetical protein [Vicinamibacteria bacterium]